MLKKESYLYYEKFWKSLSLDVKTPSFHVVLGSGFGEALEAVIEEAPWTFLGSLSFNDVPGLFKTTSPDHPGEFVFLKHEVLKYCIVIQKGRMHGYEGHAPSTATLPVMLSRYLGVKSFVLTNAAGALSLDYQPGDVMLIQDHVNLTGKNPLAGEKPTDPFGKPMGTRFADLTCAYNKEWGGRLKSCLGENHLKTHEGVYLGLLGPSLETPAEIRLFSQWGLKAVGMSTVWETICLKQAESEVVALSLISNMGCGLSGDEPMDHLSILEICRSSASKILVSVLQFIEGEWNE